ncbi:MAG: hypothetical protein PHY16_06855 [Methylobacter sp.]|nr:hypothetical protein [Methylobacter sp.]
MKKRNPGFSTVIKWLLCVLMVITSHQVQAVETQHLTDYSLCNAWKLGEEPADRNCRVNQYTDFSAGINDTLVVKINNFNALLAKAKCLDLVTAEPLPQAQQCLPQKIVLYLDGRKISDRDPVKEGKLGKDKDTVEFPLKQYQAEEGGNKDAWIDLLGSPKKDLFLRPTKIEIGLDRGYVIPGNIGFMLARINKLWFWICQVIIGVFLIAGIILAIKSDILRDSGPTPENTKKSWSLARCQMAFWLFLVVTSFLFIWLVTGALNTITDSVLGLMGIGSGTALGAALIDASEDKPEKLNKLKAQREKLQAEWNAAAEKTKVTPPPENFQLLKINQDEIDTELKRVNEQIQSINTPKKTAGFFIDLVSGPSGVTLHRFQMVVWAVILGIIFVFSVWKRLSMPEFGGMLLALQGLSAGTYLGFKIPEKSE